VQDVTYGPSWNRYTYVFNNPLRYTDPTGHEAELTVAVPTNLSGNELKAFVKELESAGLEVKADDKGKIQVTLHTTADADAAGFILGSLYGEAVAKAVHDSAASNAGTAARGGAERGRTNAAWSGEAEDAYQRMKSDPQFKSVIPTSPLGVGTDQIVKATPSGSGNLFLLMVGALKGLKGAPTKGPPTEGAPTESAATGGDGLVNEGAQLPVGRKGAPLENAPFQPVRNTPTEIGGRTYTGPALDQMQNRGLTPSVVEDTIAHGARTAGRDGAAIFTTDQARVIVNPNGSVKTVMPFSN
jgi:hypothetical protein